MVKKQNNVSGWVGWIAFASFMMILGGIFQFIVGLAAILNDKFYFLVSNYIFTWDVSVWGWIHVLVSLVVIMAGFALLNGQMWARIIAVVVAGASMLVNVAWIPYYPIWSLLIIVVDLLVIYALIVHGDELAE